MRILAVDDEPLMLEMLCDRIRQARPQAELLPFGSSRTLLSWLEEEGEGFDVAFLDIEMPGTGGYELALVLKKQYEACEIVFITEHMELVLEAFRFKPAAFVPKGQLAEELPRALRRILEKGRENPVFVTRKKNRDRIVELNQVVYLKYIYDHEVQFTLKDGSSFSETGSMKQFEAELSPKGFLRIYSNCMVNALYIVRMEREAVVLASGEQLAVARERREGVRKAYMEYLMKC